MTLLDKNSINNEGNINSLNSITLKDDESIIVSEQLAPIPPPPPPPVLPIYHPIRIHAAHTGQQSLIQPHPIHGVDNTTYQLQSIDDNTMMYNALQDISFTKLVIDLRPSAKWNQLHMRTSVNLPPPSKENEHFTLSNNESSTDVSKFNMTKYISTHTGVKYWNFMFQKVIILSESNFHYDLNQQSLDTHNESDLHPFNLDTDQWESFVLHYMLARCKKTIISVYKTGFVSFNEKYPFLCLNSSTPTKSSLELALYPSEILEDFLYLGAYESASSISQLKNLKITHIVNMAVELEDCFPHFYKYYRADLEDNFRADISKQFLPIIDFIKDAKQRGGRVLVHCAMGISRSTTAVIAYLIKELDYSYDYARAYVKKRRGIIQPNYGFSKALKEFNLQIHPDQKSINQSNSGVIVLGDYNINNLYNQQNVTQPSILSSSPSKPIIANSDGLIMSNISSSPPSSSNLINSAL